MASPRRVFDRFPGATEKCEACKKPVYFVDRRSADGKVYHRYCFRCRHCNRILEVANYISIDGVFYCKPHYDQLFKTTGSFSRSFEGASSSAQAKRSTENVGGSNTRDISSPSEAQEECMACEKTMNSNEKVTASYPNRCFCCYFNCCKISPSNYAVHEGRLYCKSHYSKLLEKKNKKKQLLSNVSGSASTGLSIRQKLRANQQLTLLPVIHKVLLVVCFLLSLAVIFLKHSAS